MHKPCNGVVCRPVGAAGQAVSAPDASTEYRQFLVWFKKLPDGNMNARQVEDDHIAPPPSFFLVFGLQCRLRTTKNATAEPSVMVH